MYPKKWEYFVDQCKSQDLQPWLDTRGKMGWELVAVVPGINFMDYIFKCPVEMP